MTEVGNCIIRQVTATNVYTFAGNNVKDYADGSQTKAEFYTPRGIMLISSGIFIVVDGPYVRLVAMRKFCKLFYRCHIL